MANAQPDRTWKRDADPLFHKGLCLDRNQARGAQAMGHVMAAAWSLLIARCPLCPRVLGCSLEGTSHELTNEAECAGGTIASGYCCSAACPGCLPGPLAPEFTCGAAHGTLRCQAVGRTPRSRARVPEHSVWALADVVLKSLSLRSPVSSSGTSSPCCVVCTAHPADPSSFLEQVGGAPCLG